MNTTELLGPITPGEILHDDFMEPMGISINQLARDIAVPPNKISEIINGKRAVTADIALRLQRYFRIEAQFWLNLQSEYDLRIMKRKIWPDIERRIIPAQNSRSLNILWGHNQSLHNIVQKIHRNMGTLHSPVFQSTPPHGGGKHYNSETYNMSAPRLFSAISRICL